MNYTQNDKILSITEKTLVVGVDIAKEVHFARAFDYRGLELDKVFSFENTREGLQLFEEWISKVQREKINMMLLWGWSLRDITGLILDIS